MYTCSDRNLKDADHKQDDHLVLIARTTEGYQNLIQILTDAELVGFYYKPKTDISVLRKRGKGIIALSACIAGEIPQLLLQDKYDEAKALALEYRDIFDAFYLEIQASDTIDQLSLNMLVIALHEDTGIPLVVTDDSHYILPEDAYAHEVLLAVQTEDIMEDSPYLCEKAKEQILKRDTVVVTKKGVIKKKRPRFKFPANDYWMKSEEEVRGKLPDYDGKLDEAIRNTVAVVEMCETITFDTSHYLLPQYPIPDGSTPDQYLTKLCNQSLLKLFQSRESVDESAYYERLYMEFNVIKDAGIAGYFLINQDFVMWAKSKGIAVGPGRGSAAGSLVAYLLGITALDPMGYRTGIPLSFDRFYIAGRKDMPDYLIA